jgi:hypothetical protein
MTRADSFLVEIEEQKKSDLPDRSSDTLSDAIAMSSPSGSMSNRARIAADKRLRDKLFGKEGIGPRLPIQPTKIESLLKKATDLRELAARGMKPRAYLKEAEKLEAEAAKLIKENEKIA